MARIITYILPLCFLLLNCSDSKKVRPIISNSEKNHVEEVHVEKVDTVFINEESLDFSITQFKEALFYNSEDFYLDGLVFSNKSMNEVVFINLYTDYFRSFTLLYDHNRIIDTIVKQIPIYKKYGERLLNTDSIIMELENHHFGLNLIDLDKLYTTKGAFIGMSEKSLINLYGDPAETYSNSQFKIAEWSYNGEYAPLFDYNKMIKPEIVTDNYGHIVQAYFINDELTALLIMNQIP